MFHRLRYIGIAAVVIAAHAAAAQAPIAQAPTATPAPLVLPSEMPQQQQLPGFTPTWTATPENQVMVEALDFVNVRSEPDPEAAPLGQIRAGEQYVATGRDFEWIQIQFDQTRRGWVFGQLVTVTGNVASLPDIGAQLLPTVIPAEQNATTTLAAITQTPGGLLTATAAARQNAAAGTDEVGSGLISGPNQVLPTFTYPPGLVAGAPAADVSTEPTQARAPVASSTGSDFPPVLPILLLGGVGLLGLLVSTLRK